jgi:hypothetical protein
LPSSVDATERAGLLKFLPQERPMAQAKSTTDHDEIRKWVEERKGRPSRVKGTTAEDEEGGILRIDFGEPEESLEEISWDEFFEIFDDRELAFLYQDGKPHGRKSYFCKLVKRNTANV